MPNRDKTGPDGKGPKTGRGLGDCLDDKVKNDPNAGQRPRRDGFGRGRGGRGRGRGRGRNSNYLNEDFGAGVGRGQGGLGRGPCAYEIEDRRNYKE